MVKSCSTTGYPEAVHKCCVLGEGVLGDEGKLRVKYGDLEAEVTLRGNLDGYRNVTKRVDFFRDEIDPSTTCHAHDNTLVLMTFATRSFTEKEESWYLADMVDMFDSNLTEATSTVLLSELGSCQELMELEPDNKCECKEKSHELVIVGVYCSCCVVVSGQVLPVCSSNSPGANILVQ